MPILPVFGTARKDVSTTEETRRTLQDEHTKRRASVDAKFAALFDLMEQTIEAYGGKPRDQEQPSNKRLTEQ